MAYRIAEPDAGKRHTQLEGIGMGVASYNRGSAVIRRRFAMEARPHEYEFMDDLNALPKYDDAGTPFDEIHFVSSHGGWFAECPKTGFGYFYKSLREAVRRWNVSVYGYKNGKWLAKPITKGACQ